MNDDRMNDDRMGDFAFGLLFVTGGVLVALFVIGVVMFVLM